MKYYTLPSHDTSYLDTDLLDSNGLLKVMPAEYYQNIPQEHLAIWCHKHAVYSLPTYELLEVVRREIGGAKAIEIGAGNGCLGRALGIPITDSCIQEREDIAVAYNAIGQPIVKYPKDIIKMEALDAVHHYKPEVVIASWVTQKWRKGDKDGFQFGVNEEALLRLVDKYIMVGNHGVHQSKRIGKYPLNFIYDDKGLLLHSRSMRTDLNCVYVWDNILKVDKIKIASDVTKGSIDVTTIKLKSQIEGGDEQ